MVNTHRIHGAAMHGSIYHQYTQNVSIYTIHGSYGIWRLMRLKIMFQILYLHKNAAV